MVEKISMPEVRELLIAVETLAVRPGNATEETIAVALANFRKLIHDRLQGQVSVNYAMSSEINKSD